ncbi:MAG: membrane protein insertion efficiency factor, partial [Terriglobales bacterium]
EAVERYGALRGGIMAAWRVLRCHPLAKGGYDPAVKDPAAKDKDKDNHQNRGQLCPRHTALIASD